MDVTDYFKSKKQEYLRYIEERESYIPTNDDISLIDRVVDLYITLVKKIPIKMWFDYSENLELEGYELDVWDDERFVNFGFILQLSLIFISDDTNLHFFLRFYHDIIEVYINDEEFPVTFFYFDFPNKSNYDYVEECYKYLNEIIDELMKIKGFNYDNQDFLLENYNKITFSIFDDNLKQISKKYAKKLSKLRMERLSNIDDLRFWLNYGDHEIFTNDDLNIELKTSNEGKKIVFDSYNVNAENLYKSFEAFFEVRDILMIQKDDDNHKIIIRLKNKSIKDYLSKVSKTLKTYEFSKDK